MSAKRYRTDQTTWSSAEWFEFNRTRAVPETEEYREARKEFERSFEDHPHEDEDGEPTSEQYLRRLQEGR